MTPYRDRRDAGMYDPAGATAPAGAPPDLDAMTKDQLLALAQSMGISPANAAMTKAELRAAVEDAS